MRPLPKRLSCDLKRIRSYAFDVLPVSQTFANRRVFAFADTGVPDGLQLDSNDNVYAGCGDGTEVSLRGTCGNSMNDSLQVFAPSGKLLGKVIIEQSSANMVFAGSGRLVIMADTKIFLANIAAEGQDLNL